MNLTEAATEPESASKVIKHVGFTGTRKGMTIDQREVLADNLVRLAEADEVWLHHGDCVGADEQAHHIAKLLGYRIHVYPGNIANLRAYSPWADRTEVPVPPLIRNVRIVRATSVLVATPSEQTGEALRSGTWATVRDARTWNRSIRVIRPDGTVQVEHPT